MKDKESDVSKEEDEKKEEKNDEEKEEKKDENKFLNKKKKPRFSLEEILTIYCKQHNIEDNEITQKIHSIYHYNPEKNIKIIYNKENGDKFPLSHHILSNQEDVKSEISNDEGKEQKNSEEKKVEEDNNGDNLATCFLCGWNFLKGMTFEEKNHHINLCIEGKGEENKKEIISTYKEIENIANTDKNQEDNSVNDEEQAQKEENNIEDEEEIHL